MLKEEERLGKCEKKRIERRRDDKIVRDMFEGMNGDV